MLHVHSLESFGSVDGPGIRFVIFLKGCRMRCRYCHNPDTWAPGAKGGEAMTVGQLLDKAERYRAYWGQEGGITVSGGEALLQIDGLIELFEEAHRRGINTCLDTAAQPFTREEPFYGKFLRLMQSADTVLLDLKHIDNEAHKKTHGMGQREHSRLRTLPLRPRRARVDPSCPCARYHRRWGSSAPYAVVHRHLEECGVRGSAALPHPRRIQMERARPQLFLRRRADTYPRANSKGRRYS